MAIGAGAAGAWAAVNATTQTVTLPAHATGDLLVVVAACKAATITSADPTITTPATGWTRAASFADGTTNSGNGLGSVRQAIFWKIATSGSETNPVVTWGGSQTASPGLAVALGFTKAGGEVWNAPQVVQAATTNATSISVTMGSNPGITSGDWGIAAHTTRDDSALTVPTWTATSATLAAVVVYPVTPITSATSDDMAATTAYRSVTSGTASAAPVVTATQAAAETGVTAFIRLRVATAAPQTATPTTAALTGTTFAPTIKLGIVPPTKALTATKFAPVLRDVTIVPTKALTATKFAPTVRLGTVAIPTTASLTGTTFAPTITVAVGGVTVTPTTAALAIGLGYVRAVLGDTPLAYWRLGEASGALVDSISGHDLTAYGPPTYGVTGALSGDPNTALTFNGSTTYLQRSYESWMNVGDLFTIEAWVKWAPGMDAMTVFATNDGPDLEIRFGSPYLRIAGGALVRHASVDLTDGQWHHVVTTKNGSAAYVYVDGVDVTVFDGDSTVPNGAYALVVAAGVDNYDYRFTGSLDEIAFYDHALTAARVAAHYAAGYTTPTVTVSNDQRVTPTTVALTATVFASTVRVPVLCMPSTATLTASRFAPAARTPVVATPTTAAVVASRFAPIATTPTTVTPTPPALSTARFAPAIVGGTRIIPSTRALTATKFAPTIRLAVVPSTKTLGLTTFAPAVAATAHQRVTPTTASLTTARFAPAVAVPVRVTPTTKALTTATFAPSFVSPFTVTPTTKALTLATLAPVATATAHVRVTPSTVTLTATRFAPTAQTPRLVTPGTRAATLTTFAPSVGQPRVATPPTLVLALAAFAPGVTVTLNTQATPGPIALILLPFAPTVVNPQSATPPTTALVLTTFVPTIPTAPAPVGLPDDLVVIVGLVPIASATVAIDEAEAGVALDPIAQVEVTI